MEKLEAENEIKWSVYGELQGFIDFSLTITYKRLKDPSLEKLTGRKEKS